MNNAQKVAALYLGQSVETSSGEYATLASIDCEGICLLEFTDGRSDVTAWQNVPAILDFMRFASDTIRLSCLGIEAQA